jgi:hypothetical protein
MPQTRRDFTILTTGVLIAEATNTVALPEEEQSALMRSNEKNYKETFTRLFYAGCIADCLYLTFKGPVDREQDEKSS